MKPEQIRARWRQIRNDTSGRPLLQAGQIHSLVDESARAMAKAHEALEPLARMYEPWMNEQPLDRVIHSSHLGSVTIYDVMRARSVLGLGR